jgi:cytoskeletal protein CcmA (bactofilin family)
MGKDDVAVNTIVGKGATFDGLLEITGGLRVDGTVKGKISSADIVLIGPSGTVDADIEAKETVIGGAVKGNIKAPDKVELQAKSQVEGNIVTYSLVVEQGAIFHGNCQMKKDKAASTSAPSPSPSIFKTTPEPPPPLKPVESTATFQKVKA